MILQFILQSRAKYQGIEILNQIKSSDRNILDFGCGNMIMTQYLADNLPRDVVGVDIGNQSSTSLEPIVYDGDTVPFDDEHFDVVLCVFVLHHCDDVEKMLIELKRLCKGKIIIIEEIYSNRYQKLITCINDLIINSFGKSGPIPFNFLTDDEWKILFNKLDLQLVHEQPAPVSPFWFHTKQKMFVVTTQG